MSSDELGMIGSSVLSIDFKDEFVLASSENSKVTVWDEKRVLDIFDVLENPHGEIIDSSEVSLENTFKLYSGLGKINT